MLLDSSFFRENARDLPSPEEIRRKAIQSNGTYARSSRPPPVSFEDLGLIVKYGSEITVAEAQCLWYFNRYMKDRVPTPELFGWCCDKGETFIYMQLIRGETLEEAWPSITEEEGTAICLQLRSYVEAWRELRQESEPYYIGEHIATKHLTTLLQQLTPKRSHRATGRRRHHLQRRRRRQLRTLRGPDSVPRLLRPLLMPQASGMGPAPRLSRARWSDGRPTRCVYPRRSEQEEHHGLAT